MKRILVLFISLTIVHCGAGSNKEGGKKEEKKKTEYEISCKGDTAIRKEIFDGKTLREGPVKLPAGTSCKKASSRTGSAAKKLPRDGQWTRYFRDSTKILGQGPYKNDQREGLWKYQDKNGQRTRTSTYAADEKHGPEVNYYPGAAWKSKGSYANGKRNGPWQIKIDASGSCISEGSYADSVKDGNWKDCGLNKSGKGYLAFEGGYSQGMRDGPATIFHSNGKPLAKGRHRADMACAAAPPKDDITLCSKRTGDWEIFHANGKLAWKGAYDGAGKKTGTWTEYYQTGSVLAKGTRSSGRRSGTWKYYTKTGGIFGEFRFRRSDFLVDHATLYENGKKLGSGPLKNALLKYSPTKDSISLSNAKRAGRWVEYHASGQKSGEGEYSFGNRKGKWIHYSTGGGKVAEGNYSFNKKHGVWKELKGGAWQTIEYRLGKPK